MSRDQQPRRDDLPGAIQAGPSDDTQACDYTEIASIEQQQSYFCVKIRTRGLPKRVKRVDMSLWDRRDGGKRDRLDR